MTLRETSKALWSHSKIAWLRFFFPLHYHNGQLLIMRPSWYNGHFSMRSLNKVRG